MIIVKCKKTLHMAAGTKSAYENFKAGNKYKYYELDSTDNHHHVQGEVGNYSIFNNEEFYKYFNYEKTI